MDYQSLKLPVITESTIHRWGLLCDIDDAMHDGGTVDPHFYRLTESFSEDLFDDMLETIKEFLLRMCATLASHINAYVLNNSSLMVAYRDLILDRFSKLKAPLVIRMHDYKFEETYPYKIPAKTMLNADVALIRDAIYSQNMTGEEIGQMVDHSIDEFGVLVLGSRMKRGYLGDLEHAVTNEVRAHICSTTAPPRQIILNKKRVEQFMDECANHKKMIKDVNETKQAIIADYEALKKSNLGGLRSWHNATIRSMSVNHRHPELAKIHEREAISYEDIKTEYTRLFNSYLTIYRVAFSAKLSIMQEAVNSYRMVIDELMKRTDLFTEIRAQQVGEGVFIPSNQDKLKF